jgi:hypothetical protein
VEWKFPVFVASLLAALGGCKPFETKEQIIAECEFEAAKHMVSSPLTGNARRAAENRIAITCLEVRGLKMVMEMSRRLECEYSLGPGVGENTVVWPISKCWEQR